jgi:hypothetical protein
LQAAEDVINEASALIEAMQKQSARGQQSWQAIRSLLPW